MLFSIYPATQNSTGDAIAGVIVLLLMAIVWRVRKSPHKLSPYGMIIALFLCLVHYLFPQTGGDFNSYKDWVETSGFTNVDIISMYYMHFEKVYYVIVNFVHNDYFLFRLVVWGTSLILFCFTAKRLEIDFNIFVFFLCIGIVPMTSTSRVCLAYAIAFFGFSFITKPITRRGSNLLSFIIGSLLVLLSLYFHRSAIFLLLPLPLSLFNINKNTLKLLPILFAVIVVFLNSNLYSYLNGQSENSFIDSETAFAYLQANEKTFGVGHLLRLALRYAECFALFILIIKCILDKTYISWPKYIKSYANATLLITILAATFLFVSGNTYKSFERLVGFNTIPQCILLAYLLKNDIKKKLVNIIILLLAGYVAYNIIYDQIYLG